MKAGRLPERAFVSPSDILWSGLAVGGRDVEIGGESDSGEEGEIDGDVEGIDLRDSNLRERGRRC